MLSRASADSGQVQCMPGDRGRRREVRTRQVVRFGDRLFQMGMGEKDGADEAREQGREGRGRMRWPLERRARHGHGRDMQSVWRYGRWCAASVCGLRRGRGPWDCWGRTARARRFLLLHDCGACASGGGLRMFADGAEDHAAADVSSRAAAWHQLHCPRSRACFAS